MTSAAHVRRKPRARSTAVAETEYMREVQAWLDSGKGRSAFHHFGGGRGPTVPRWGHDIGTDTDARRELVKKYAFSIPTRSIIEQLTRHGPFIEVGAGTGYWAYELQQAGADVIATDLCVGDDRTFDFEREWLPIEQAEAEDAAREHANRTLIIAWPDDFNNPRGWSDDALEAYERAGGQRVVYIGEGDGGCTGSDRFHHILWHRWHSVLELQPPQWDGINDYVEVYEVGAGKRQRSWGQIEAVKFQHDSWEDDDDDDED